LYSQTADWIKQKKAVIVLKMVDMVGFDDNDMQNEITVDNINNVLLIMEITKNPLRHMHGVFE